MNYTLVANVQHLAKGNGTNKDKYFSGLNTWHKYLTMPYKYITISYKYITMPYKYVAFVLFLSKVILPSSLKAGAKCVT